MEFRKMVLIKLFAGQQWIHRLKDTVWRREEGEGGIYEESNMETRITIFKTNSQWEFAIWLSELKPGLCNNLEGWDGEGGSCRRGHMYTYGWFMLMFGRNENNSVKQLSFNLIVSNCDVMDYTVHGILQARILKWIAFPFSRGFSQPRDQTQVFRIAGEFFTSWATREARFKK